MSRGGDDLENVESKGDYRKFLKEPTSFRLDLGDYIPNIQIENVNRVFLYDLIKSNYLIAVFLSTTCSSCEQALEGMQTFCAKNPEINIAAFIHTEPTLFEMLKKYVNNLFPLFYMDKEVMKFELQVKSFPLGLTINGKGQVLESGPVGAEFSFERLKTPLRKLL